MVRRRIPRESAEPPAVVVGGPEDSDDGLRCPTYSLETGNP
jgi:hypothetical protein